MFSRPGVQHKRCPQCPSGKKPIGGTGPADSVVLFVGEAPGKQEDRRRDREGNGTPFIGDSGVELDNLYLPLAGLRRGIVRVTNIMKCIPALSGGTPTEEQARCCAAYWLPDEVDEVKPQVIVTLGAVAYRTMFPELAMAHPLERQHGIAREANYAGWRGIVMPMYHPAAGLRSGEYMGMLIDDFKALGRLLKSLEWFDGVVVLNPPEIATFYTEIEDKLQLFAVLEEPPEAVAMDTETSSGLPYCMSFSTKPGEGYVVRAGNTAVLSLLNEVVNAPGVRTVLHNSLFDIPILADMGIHVPMDRMQDTMIMAYHLGLPQSLKSLAYRLCGLEMSDFEDVVRPYAMAEAVAWLSDVYNQMVADHYDATLCDDLKMATVIGVDHALYPPASVRGAKGKVTAYRNWLCESYQRRLLLPGLKGRRILADHEWIAKALVSEINHSRTGAERTMAKVGKMASQGLNWLMEPGAHMESPDPWGAWNNDWSETDRLFVGAYNRVLAAKSESQPRSLPPFSISFVPWREAVYYSAQDADGTLRVYRELLLRGKNTLKRYMSGL